MNDMLARVGGPRRLMVIVAGVAAISLVLVVSQWAAAPTWVPVVSGAPLESTGSITDQLDQAGIPNRLERGGLDVSVRATDIARARVALARAGVPAAGRPGMEIFDKPAYAMTDFTQRINYRRALEGELERTIGKMQGIESAKVHLAMHETSTFRSASSPREASVVLKLRNSEEPPADVVRGIAQLVASGVDGLETDHVSVLDERGRLLSAASEPASVLGLTSRQFSIQQEIEAHLKAKAEAIVSEVVGRGNARVQVAASINFDRVERTVQNVDPEKQVAFTEQKAEIVPGAQGGAGSSNSATTFENSRSTEVYAPAVGGLKRLTVAVLINGSPDSVRGLAAPGPEHLARIETLVRGAVGFDSARGDLVSVVSVPFAATVPPAAIPEPAAPTAIETVREYQPLIVRVGAIVMAFVLGLLMLRASKSSAISMRAPAALDGADAGTRSVPAESQASRLLADAAQTSSEARRRVGVTVNQQPDMAAKVVRAWMKEA
jgi:flagellar M-ring protein FliF